MNKKEFIENIKNMDDNYEILVHLPDRNIEPGNEYPIKAINEFKKIGISERGYIKLTIDMEIFD